MGLRAEALVLFAYFASYLVYLSYFPEGELLHWISLVTLPFVVVHLIRRSLLGRASVSATLASAGVERGNLRSGLWTAIVIGLGISALKLVLSDGSGRIPEIITSGQILLLFPLAFIMVLLTAAATEEFFFRGLVQTRLAALLGTDLRAILLTALLFDLYHVPYAYFSPVWPTQGDLPQAVAAAVFQGGIGGLVFGYLL